MNILKNLFTKLYKRPSNEEDEDHIVAYFNMALTEDENLIVDGDFVDGHDELASKFIFPLCSGAIHDIVIEWVSKKCDGDEERANKILEDAYNMIDDKYGDDDDEDEPVVDPCQVFKQNNHRLDEQSEDME